MIYLDKNRKNRQKIIKEGERTLLIIKHDLDIISHIIKQEEISAKDREIIETITNCTLSNADYIQECLVYLETHNK